MAKGPDEQRDVDTEERIFRAARDVFHECGYDGARMQEIARRAGINKALLHYYFRSKERLFDAVFRASAMRVMPALAELLGGELPLREKIEVFVRQYTDTILDNPHLPGFIIHELNRNPTALQRIIRGATSGAFERFRQQVEDAVARGEIRPIAPEELLINLVGLCVFPFVARPMIQAVTGFSGDAYTKLLRARQESVSRFILEAIAP